MKKKFILFLIVFLAVFAGCSPRENGGSSEPPPDSNEDALFLYEDSGLYGYINNQGVWIIQPQYLYGTQFSEGLAYVKTSDGRKCYINAGGEIIIPDDNYSAGGRFHNGIAVVSKDPNIGSPDYYYGDYMLINMQGEQISNEEVSNLNGFCEGYAAYYQNWGGGPFYDRFDLGGSYLNTEGKPATEYVFTMVSDFSNGYAAVGIWDEKQVSGDINLGDDIKWGVINQEFELVIDYQYDDMGAYADGLIPVKLGAKWGYIDIRGETIIPFQYDDANNYSSGGYYRMEIYSYGQDYYLNRIYRAQQGGLHFSEGLACVCKDGKLGYINLKGEWVIPPQYNAAKPFSEGLAAVSKNEWWGFVNNKGELLIPIQYEEVMNCVNGLIAVGDKDGNFLYYIDKTGKMIVPTAD